MQYNLNQRIFSLYVLHIFANVSTARLFNRIPSSVCEIFFPLRINNVIPRSSSNAAICLESVGWVICNCSAAFVKLCSFATVKKWRNSLNSMFFNTYTFQTLILSTFGRNFQRVPWYMKSTLIMPVYSPFCIFTVYCL